MYGVLMKNNISVVVTSISQPNNALHSIAKGCKESGYRFTVIGDVSSPSDFYIDHCNFYSISDQLKIDLKYPKLCPERHYARKNIGYLLELQNSADIIIDTDDDNLPYDSFWKPRERMQQVRMVEYPGWINVYRYFTEELVWPRGLPLNEIYSCNQSYELLTVKTLDCPIHQGLANKNPDVDAIYRLILPLPKYFRDDRRLALGKDVWSPFNSQNTAWYRDTFPLLYLPAYCSFRMTDILRSFVAQRIAWENGWTILFHEPTVWQERNEHNLMKDFAQEIPCYLNSEEICEELSKLSIKRGKDHLFYNLEISYRMLIEMGVVGKNEVQLLMAWIDDFKKL